MSVSPSVNLGNPFCKICASYFALLRVYGMRGSEMEKPCLIVGVLQTNFNPSKHG